MPSTPLAFALALLCTASCGSPPGPARPTPAAERAPNASTEPAGLALGVHGIAQVPATIEVSQEGLNRALPGYTVELVAADDYTEEHFVVKAGEERVLEIRFASEGDRRTLSSVDVVSSQVRTDLGIAIGATHAEVTRALGRLACSDGGEESDAREALVVCTTPARKNIVLEFIDADEDGSPRRPASEVLGDEAGLPAVKLVTITWSPG